MQIGNYSIPESPHRLPELIIQIKKIYEVYDRNEIKDALKNDTLAKLLGYKSSNNGSYQRKLRAFRDYGLLEGKGSVKVTLRTENILYGKEEDKNQALREAFLSIPLWNKLFEKYGKSLPQSDFWAHIKEITGCSPKEAQDKEAYIKEAFAKDASVISDLDILNSVNMESEQRFKTREEPRQTSAVKEKGEEEIATELLKAGAYELAKQYIDFLQKKRNTNGNSTDLQNQDKNTD